MWGYLIVCVGHAILVSMNNWLFNVYEESIKVIDFEPTKGDSREQIQQLVDSIRKKLPRWFLNPRDPCTNKALRCLGDAGKSTHDHKKFRECMIKFRDELFILVDKEKNLGNKPSSAERMLNGFSGDCKDLEIFERLRAGEGKFRYADDSLAILSLYNPQNLVRNTLCEPKNGKVYTVTVYVRIMSSKGIMLMEKVNEKHLTGEGKLC